MTAMDYSLRKPKKLPGSNEGMAFKLKIVFLFILFGLFTALACFAQQRTVTGHVGSADNQPVPGISVTVKGTTTGTSTDANGNFSILAPTGSTLVFSGVGM